MTEVEEGLSHRTRALGAAAKAFAGGAMVVLIIVTSLSVFRLEHLEKVAAKERDLIADQTSLIIECTTAPQERTPPVYSANPKDCFVRGEVRRSDTVRRIGDLSAIAAACGAATPGNIPATRQCVEKAINDQEGQP